MSYFNLIKLNATPSTNDFLKERHQKGLCMDGDLVWSKDQTCGRGQRDRVWLSNPEESLTFSIYKAFDEFSVENAFLISAAVSIGIVDGLRSVGIPHVSIKWPNDILSDSKKIAGILIENIFKQNKLKASIIGIGMNVNQIEFQELPNAASLASVSGRKFDKKHVFEVLKFELEKSLSSLHSIPIEDFFLKYSDLLWKKDKMAVFNKNNQMIQAIIRGVTPSGFLILEDTLGKTSEMNSNQIRINYEN